MIAGIDIFQAILQFLFLNNLQHTWIISSNLVTTQIKILAETGLKY